MRDNVGCSSLRGDNDYVYLPPSFSKWQCYLAIIHAAGWKPVYSNINKGKFKPIGEWKPRDGFYLTPSEAANHEGGAVVRPIVSWRSFRRCWIKKFPKLRVRSKGEDTCPDCYLLKLKLDRIAREKAELLSGLDPEEIDGITPEDLAEQIEGYDEIIRECRKHFDMHVAQREMYKDLKQELKATYLIDCLLSFLRSSW